MVRKIISVKRIVLQEGTDNPGFLMRAVPCQPLLAENVESTAIHEGGYLLLDFGTELHGGIEYAVQKVSACGAR